MNAIKYSISATNEFVIKINAPKQIIDGVVVEGPVDTTISFRLQENTKPLEILTYLQAEFQNRIVFDNETLDAAVVYTMNMLNDLKGNNFNISKIKNKKVYAKYYYKLFAGNNTDEVKASPSPFKETVLIVIGLFQWWYIRRLVHIFVVFTIIENLSQPMAVIAQPIPIESKSNVEINILKQAITDLSNMLSQKTTALDTKTAELNKLATIQITLDDVTNQLKSKDKIIMDLRQQLIDFKELLLHSTSMIFRIEEVPNLINAP
jgi:hypothetical protein